LPYAAVPAGLFLLHSAWAAMLGYQLGILLFLAARPRLLQLEPRVSRATNLWGAVMLAVCLLSGPLAVLLWPGAARLSGAGLAAWLSGEGIAPSAWPWFVASMCITTPWLEELYWRAWLGRSVRPALETSAWFAGYHLLVLMPVLRPAWLALAFFSLTSAGWAWQGLLRSRNGFRWAVFCHAAADISVMLAATWLLKS
jgi:hypothetical protein